MVEEIVTHAVGVLLLAHVADLSAFAGCSAIPLNLLNRIIGLCRLFRYPNYKVKKLYQKGIVDPALVLVPMLPSYARLVAPDSNVDTPYPPASLQIDG